MTVEASFAAGARGIDDSVRGYGALRSGAMLVDRSARSRGTFAGEKAAEVLTGLVTNDVTALAPGLGQFAAALTARGKIIADLRLFARSDHIFVDVGERAAPGWWQMIRKYVNPRLAKYADVSGGTGDVGVFGPRSRGMVGAALELDPAALETLPMYGHREVMFGDDRLLVARVPDLGLEGYEIFARLDVMPAIRARLEAAGATAGSAAAFHIARIEAGRPEWGVDMDDSTLAQEANLDELGAISYTKGCYTGQETVARVHFRGHVNRTMRGVRFDGAPAPTGAQLAELTGERRAVGDVRSSGRSPRLGAIGLAMVRREVASGTSLQATWPEGRTVAVVSDLPFPL
jgi:folate-binding protein YgfZ